MGQVIGRNRGGKSQRARVLEYLKKRGDITQLQALVEFGCFRLAARIEELRRAGHSIKSVKRTAENGGSYTKYLYMHGLNE
jgi:hypothetical protein